MQYLIAIAIAVIVAVIIIWRLFATESQRRASQGTLRSGATPSYNSLDQRWTTAPTTVTVGENTTFVLTVISSQVSGTEPVTGRLYAIDVQPSADISIVSITPANSDGPHFGSTSASGTITVVIVANSAPSAEDSEESPRGVIVAQQVNDTTSGHEISSSFTIE